MIRRILAAFGVVAAIMLSSIGVATAATTAQASFTGSATSWGPPWG